MISVGSRYSKWEPVQGVLQVGVVAVRASNNVEDDDDAPAQTGHELTANALCRANANECRACR